MSGMLDAAVVPMMYNANLICIKCFSLMGYHAVPAPYRVSPAPSTPMRRCPGGGSPGPSPGWSRSCGGGERSPSLEWSDRPRVGTGTTARMTLPSSLGGQAASLGRWHRMGAPTLRSEDRKPRGGSGPGTRPGDRDPENRISSAISRRPAPLAGGARAGPRSRRSGAETLPLRSRPTRSLDHRHDSPIVILDRMTPCHGRLARDPPGEAT
ncbi:hypothetical protein BH23PLA1_BH23PLA1_30030 [soil metagenome]